MKILLGQNIFAQLNLNLQKILDCFIIAKPLLQVKSLESIYFAYIHSYINYANIAWGSTYRTKLKTIYFHQKHAVRIVFNEDKLTHSRPLLRALHSLNVYQINLYRHLNFINKLNTNQVPSIFNDLIKKPEHKYLTKFSKICFSLKTFSLKTTKYAISYCDPKIWNDFLTKSEKELQSLSVFKKTIHTKLLKNEHELDFL